MELLEGETTWRDRQPWLQSHGYQLRARYQPDWEPSWITNPPKNKMDSWLREDHQTRLLAQVMDAVRMRDGKPVILKSVKLPRWEDNHEFDIIRYLSHPDIREDPQNKCVPIYEVLSNVPDDPSIVIVVMPLLRNFDSPRFDTVGECLGFFKEMFEGIQFLHRHRIAHRDCSGPNLMIDASELYPDGFHPYKHSYNRTYTGNAVQKYTRTQRPPKYYWIDFGLAVRFEESDDAPKFPVLRGNDKSPPEFQDPEYMANPQDPFPTDIYYLGNLIRRYFTAGWPEFDHFPKSDLRFMEPLVAAMVQRDRAKRPTIDQCIAQLDAIIRSQSSWTLRSQIWDSGDNIFTFIYHFLLHWIRRITYIITQTPAIPRPNT